MTHINIKNIKKQLKSFCLNIDSLEIKRGSTTALTGANGSGKSTLLDIVGLLVIPDSGSYLINSINAYNHSQNRLLFYRKQISYLQQNPYIFSMGVEDNIGLGLKLRKTPVSELNRKVQSILEEMKLNHLVDRKPNELSGGERQRIAFARQIILDCQLYLFDEPTANVDSENIHLIENKIKELCSDSNKTILISTHSKHQAYSLCDKILTMHDGQISDMPYENVFRGTVIIESDGTGVFKLNESLSIKYIPGSVSPEAVSVRPEDILLSNEKITASARNCIKGHIVKIEKLDNYLRIKIHIGVDIYASITENAFYQMELNIGKPVWVIFKAASVVIL